MTQKQMILQHLLEGKPIDPIESLREYGCYRLGAIIHILRKEGHLISTKYTCHKNKYGHTTHYAIYKLIKEK